MLVCGSVAAALATEVSARHPVSIVEAEIFVNRRQATVRLKCFAEDLELLQGVEPREDGKYDSDEIRAATQDHAQYLAEKIRFLDVNGETIPATVTGVVDAELPSGGADAGTLMRYTLEVELELKYPAPPEFITIQQDMVAEGQLLPSELKVLLKQAGSQSPYTRMLKPGSPETFRFDWDRPALSPEESKEEWDSWFEQQREQTLGISSYSSVYSFIYINDHEVRNEVLVPLANLAAMIEFERADPSFLSIEEQSAAAKQIRRFFSFGNPVQIDGIEVAPVFDRVDFYGLDLKDFAVQADKRKVSMASGRVGIIMRYPAKGRPLKVDVAWDKFNEEALRSVDAVAFPYKEVAQVRFSMFLENNVYSWQATDAPELPSVTEVDLADDRYHVRPVTVGVPVIATACFLLALCASGVSLFRPFSPLLTGAAALLCVAGFLTARTAEVQVQSPLERPGSLAITNRTASTIFLQLHRNLFRSFDYSDESRIYDTLDRSVAGPLLRKLYLQINDSLRIAAQGGAVSRIEDVQVLEGRQQVGTFIENGFQYRCKWNIVGTIEHWGHIHERTNQYDALFEIKVINGAWKIVKMDVLDQPQGVVKTRLRTL